MAHHEVVLPPEIDYGMTGGPGFSTTVNVGNTGYETRNQNWADARRFYEITAGEKSTAAHETLLGFFLARKGRLHSFNLYDWTDYGVEGQNIGTGTGGALNLQLKKTYSDGQGYTTDRTIKKPKNGTVAVYYAGVLKTEGVHYSVNYTTGVITTIVHPTLAQAVTADFEFYTPVRFDVDKAPIEIVQGNLYVWGSVPLVEELL
jgi:uncharacterized protein (TIGR02217 family)